MSDVATVVGSTNVPKLHHPKARITVIHVISHYNISRMGDWQRVNSFVLLARFSLGCLTPLLTPLNIKFP